MNRNAMAFAVVGILSACGGPGSVSGTVAGNSLSVRDAIFTLHKNDKGETDGLLLAMSDKPDMCASAKANREPKQATAVLFGLVRVTDMGSMLAPDVGDYTVISAFPTRGGNYAFASFSHTDANCTSTISESASKGSSGIIKLTSLKGEVNGYASGTFDITFGASDKVTGSFNAAYCDLQSTSSKPNCE